MNKYCTYDQEMLIERPPEFTIGKPDYVCLACGRVYQMRYPASAVGSDHLELVYDPERSGPDSPWIGDAAGG